MENEEIKREIGDILKAERAKKGLSLEEVQAAIKINKRFIKALEDSDFSKMPTPVAAKGFLKNYASFLCLDVKKILAQFSEKYTMERPALKMTEPVKRMDMPNLPLKNLDAKMIGIFTLAVLLVLILILIFTFMSCSGKKKNPVPNREIATVVSPITGAKFITLEVQSISRAWILINIDGVPLSSEVVAPGDRKVFTARDSISIKTGNAGGVRVIFNGKNLGTLGDVNAVVEKQFSR